MNGIRLIQVVSFAAAVSALSTPALAAGDHGHGGGHGAAIGEPAKASAATRTVEVKLGDIFYEPKTVRVEQGETVRFVLKNSGELLHEFNIGTAAMHAEHQKEMLKMMESGMLTTTGINTEMAKSDHSSHSNEGGHAMKHDDPNSVLVEPGKTKDLVWTFTQAADLEFACNIPGHYESGMVGNFRFGH
jgi:uncharacterized cupredoxin-like copper-binding protein